MLTMCLFLSSHLLSSDFVDDTQSQGHPHTEPAHGAEEAERLSVLWRGRHPPQAVRHTDQGGESEQGEGLVRVGVGGEVGEAQQGEGHVLQVTLITSRHLRTDHTHFEGRPGSQQTQLSPRQVPVPEYC